MARPKRSTRPPTPDVRVECFLLCDYVRLDGGKLYILGGGWDRIAPPRLPYPYRFSIAFRATVPLGTAAEGVPLQIDLVDDHGRSMEPEVEVINVRVAPDQGASLNERIPITIPLGVELTFVLPGKYTLRLSTGATVLAEASFRVEDAPAGEDLRGESASEGAAQAAVAG